MRVAALYDIHGNLPALEAVLHDVQQAGVDQVVVGGDVVPGPMSRETVAALLNLDIPAHFIRGNGEHEVLAMLAGVDTGRVPEQFREMIRWVGHELTSEQARLLGDWPQTFRLPIPGLGDVLFCHGTPRDDNEVFTRVTPEERLLPVFAPVDEAVVICGHTHMQFDRQIGRHRVVNAGSVGAPWGTRGRTGSSSAPTSSCGIRRTMSPRPRRSFVQRTIPWMRSLGPEASYNLPRKRRWSNSTRRLH
ncbi:MAG: metallophosphoesterase family protein [Longimicrobiales bacterium]